MQQAVFAILAAGALLGGACGGGGTDDDSEPALFPEDYAATYQEVHGCRRSGEHDLMFVRILAAPDALTVYQQRNAPFPVGAIVLKEEYDTADDMCEGPILQYTVMQKLEAGAAPADLDWKWQKVDESFRTMKTDLKRCTSCHARCGVPAMGGHDGACGE